MGQFSHKQGKKQHNWYLIMWKQSLLKTVELLSLSFSSPELSQINVIVL